MYIYIYIYIYISIYIIEYPSVATFGKFRGGGGTDLFFIRNLVVPLFQKGCLA